MQGARLALGDLSTGARPRGFRMILLGALLLLGALAGVAALSSGAGALTTSSTPPNILLILTDDQRLQGTMQVMPKTLQWFEQGGTEFPQGYVTTPLCCPARASVFSGQYAHNHGVRTNADGEHFDPRYSIERYLHDAGYLNGIFGKYFNDWDMRRDPLYFDKWAICPCGYNTFRVNEQGVDKIVNQYSTSYIRDKALTFLQEAETNDTQPWFMEVAPFAPHPPQVPEAQYANASVPPFQTNPASFEADVSDKPPFVQYYSVNQQTIMNQRDDQLRTLMSVDDMVDQLFQTLQATGEDQNTLAIFMSDNGYMWGEHGLDAKNRPYLDSIKVPFFMRWPGHVTAGAVDNRFVSNIDLAPTFADVAGATPVGPLDGHDILDSQWQRSDAFTEYFYGGSNITSWASILTSTAHYIEYYRKDDPGSIIYREYYDLTSDPYELDNLLSDGNPANDPSTAALSAQIAEDRTCSGPSCP
jgi:arylsulfatase A-like enzyme